MIFGKTKNSAHNLKKETKKNERNEAIDLFNFRLHALCPFGHDFCHYLYPVPETKTVTVQKINETIYDFTPEDHMITSKFYNSDGYFLVVYNEKSKNFDIEKVKEEIWKNKDIKKQRY